uniref:Uncharacterized protein n=1 Tax=Anguilla anguilla TaxID=7936 RepID=A0A0E9SY83_ANGAN
MVWRMVLWLNNYRNGPHIKQMRKMKA